MDNETFEKLVDEAIALVPKEFLDKLENVTILVEDYPTHHQVMKIRKKGTRGMLLGLYEGVPQTKRGQYGIGGALPDKITIFRIPILKISRSYEDVKQIVQNTVKHEIAHHFGMDERQIHQAVNKNNGEEKQ